VVAGPSCRGRSAFGRSRRTRGGHRATRAFGVSTARSGAHRVGAPESRASGVGSRRSGGHGLMAARSKRCRHGGHVRMERAPMSPLAPATFAGAQATLRSEPCVCDATRSPRLERAVAQPESSSRAGIDALLEPLRGPAQRRIEIRVSAHVRRRAGLLELLYAGFGGQEHSDPNARLASSPLVTAQRLAASLMAASATASATASSVDPFPVAFGLGNGKGPLLSPVRLKLPTVRISPFWMYQSSPF